MDSTESRSNSTSSSVIDWPGPHTVVIPRAESGFGFTLRHFVVYPPQSVLDDSKDDQELQSKASRPRLSRELSLEPQDTIFVKTVKEGSPAHIAGLNTGDRVIAVNGDSISGKSYRDIIEAIHNSSHTLKLLVVPKDEDILQMAYPSQTRDSLYASSGSLSDNLRVSAPSGYHQHSHSTSEILHGSQDLSQDLEFDSNKNLPLSRHDVRHSYPLSQWGVHDTDFRVGTSLRDLPNANQCQDHGLDSHMNPSQGSRSFIYQQSNPMSQDSSSSMTSNFSIPSKSKYSFGLYFPPKSSTTVGSNSSSSNSSRTLSAESLGRGYHDPLEPPSMAKSQTFEISHRQPAGSYRKTSLEDSPALSSSAKSRDYFIRYSSDKAASDSRNRYSPRHSAYERYSTDTRPACYISRSQTVSTISPTQLSNAGRYTTDYSKSSCHGSDYSSDSSHSRQYIPVLSESRLSGSSDISNRRGEYGRGSRYSEQSDAGSGSRTFVVRIPYEQQQQNQQPYKVTESGYVPVRQNYGTTFALTRAPNATHIEIQKSIGKPIVSQRKYQFESGKNENTPPPGNGGYNRYKTEIEKIRTQPKFNSIAMRKASFEQSPERDPPGFDDPVEEREQTPPEYPAAGLEASQPTVKVRKISTERYNSGSPDSLPIRIYVSPGNTNAPSSPIVEILPMFPGDNSKRQDIQDSGQNSSTKPAFKSSKEAYFHSPSNSSCSVGSSGGGGTAVGEGAGGLVDSGVWVKSYHSSSDMLDGGVASVPADTVATTTECPPALESRSSYIQTPHQHLAQSQALPYPVTQSSSIIHPIRATSPQPRAFLHPKGNNYPSDSQSFSSFPSSDSSHSLNSVSSGNVPVASVAPTVMSASDGSLMLGLPDGSQGSMGTAYVGANVANVTVTMRKKIQDTSEDQANKLHRRTSYLMATARDRTNTVPIEQAFSPPQVVTDHRPQQQTTGSGGPVRHQSSVKLNKFFGEKIPSIAEGVEMKSIDQEEPPPEVIRKGPLSCKISVIEGKKCSDRSWKTVFAVLRQNELFLTRERETSSASSGFEDQHIPLRSCMVEFARDYAKKKKNVFRMTTHNECEYLFQTEDRGTMLCWIQAIKSINEPEKAEKMDEMIASERERFSHAPVEINIVPSVKVSPQLGQKGKKLSALSFKNKLASSPSMRRKKSNASEKDKEETVKKSWKGRIPMMKSLKKHSEDSNLSSMAEQEMDTDKMQFGMPLEDCFPSPHNEYVPLIVELCTRIVEARGLEVVGVYRVPGNSAAVNALVEEFNRGIDSVNIDNEKLLDINVISSLLKSFFRKLPEPLIPAEHYEAFIEANRYPEEGKRKLKIKRLLHLLPSHHNETFKHMAEHLNKVASYGNINKMDAKNLAIMFGPTLVRKKGDDTASLVTDMSDQCRIVESIILHHDWFFSTWDLDSYIPMETTVETVPVDEAQSLLKDDDDEAESAISTKEIISSIVGAASKKLRKQQGKSMDSLDMLDSSCSTTPNPSSYNEQSIDDAVYLASITKSFSSIATSRSASEEFLERKASLPVNRYQEAHTMPPSANSEPDFMELEYADAGSPSSSNFTRHLSDDSMLDKNDELEISHGLPTSLSRNAIHNTLKRIGNDVSALLHTFEQKQLKERERRRLQQEVIEKEHQRTQLELEQEENHSVEDWLALKGMTASRMPDLVSSSYLGETYPYEPNSPVTDRRDHLDGMKERPGNKAPTTQATPHFASVPPHLSGMSMNQNVDGRQDGKSKMIRGGSHEDILSHTKSQKQESSRPVAMRGPSQRRLQEMQQRNLQHLAVGGDRGPHRPTSFRNSLGRRHGSLDSLIDMIDKQEKRASWASSDSEDGSDLLTSITTTFDQKLQILLNPKYKLTGGGRKSTKNDSSNGAGPATHDGAKNLGDSSKTKAVPPSNLKQVYTIAALLDSDRSFRDPSLHRSAKSDPKIGIASRFERNDAARAASSSPVTSVSTSLAQPRKNQFPDFRTFMGKSSSQPKEPGSVVLTQPKKLDSDYSKNSKSERVISKSEKTERNSNLARLSKDDKFFSDSDSQNKQSDKENNGRERCRRREGRRRHTVGGVEDFDHISALSQIRGDHNIGNCSGDHRSHRLSAWEQLQPAVKDPGPPANRNMQAWIQRERLRGSTPDLTCQEKQ